MTTSTTDRPYTVKEVAAKLDTNIKTAYDAIRRGEIPSMRVGRLILVPRAAFDRMLETGKAP
jgi:excisionase family DNA binding protein